MYLRYFHLLFIEIYLDVFICLNINFLMDKTIINKKHLCLNIERWSKNNYQKYKLKYDLLRFLEFIFKMIIEKQHVFSNHF